MNEDMFKIVGIIVIVGFLIYLATKAINIHLNAMEGFSMPTIPGVNSTASTSSGETSGSVGKAAEAFKTATIQLQDTLLINKYRNDYENLIMNMDDYFKLLVISSLSNNKYDEAVKYNSYQAMLENAMVIVNDAK